MLSYVYNFQFRFMAFAVDVINRRGPSSEIRFQLQPKTTYYLEDLRRIILIRSTRDFGVIV